MAKLRHVAMSVRDPEATARFYCDVFGMEIAGKTDSELATGLYLTDGTICLALLEYKSDQWAGGDKDTPAINHIGFWVDDVDEQVGAIKDSGGTYFAELPVDKDTLDYEMKFRDPNGIIFDISHTGWTGASK